MPCAIEIVDNETGRTSVYRCDDGWDEDLAFMWTEGQNGCDCNRGLFFALAAGEPDPGVPCGEDRFSVSRVMLEDGTVVRLD